MSELDEVDARGPRREEAEGVGPLRPREQGVALRGVSRVVARVKSAGHRVEYRMRDGGTVAPERVVLMRCRAVGYACFRIPPYLWRLLPQVVGEPALAEYRQPMSAEDVTSVERLRRRKALIEAVLAAVSPRRLAELCARHAGNEVDPRHPGIPDLMVFKRARNGRPMGLRFAEVKRPAERLKAHQREEIAFMRQIGIRAGVFRFIELKEVDANPVSR